jgi:hypothetical protein
MYIAFVLAMQDTQNFDNTITVDEAMVSNWQALTGLQTMAETLIANNLTMT